MVNELKKRQQKMRDKHNILGRDEIYHGALEDILLGKEITCNQSITDHVSMYMHIHVKNKVVVGSNTSLDHIVYDKTISAIVTRDSMRCCK